MHLSECMCCLPGLVRGQCKSRSRGLPPSLLLHMLRLTSQYCRVLLHYGLLPGFGDLLKAVRLCWLGILPHFILPWWTRKPLNDVTFCHPHVHFQRDFSLPLSVLFFPDCLWDFPDCQMYFHSSHWFSSIAISIYRWCFLLDISACRTSSSASLGQLQGHQLVPPFTDVSPPTQHSRRGEQWLLNNV